jgi:Tol biopolymer transport system component
VVFVACSLVAAVARASEAEAGGASRGSEELLAALRKLPYKLVYETRRDGAWDLVMVNADGSQPVKLTRTPDVNELYPHVSPDGTKICFVVDEGAGDATVRSVYFMNMDGTRRTLVARHAQWPCWSPDGLVIAYLRMHYVADASEAVVMVDTTREDTRFTYWDHATRGLYFYDLETGTHAAHPAAAAIHHLHNPCWSPDRAWIVATVHAGMGYGHANLAIEAAGSGIFDLGMRGCRPDVRFDGRKVAWSLGDFSLGVADLELGAPPPRAAQQKALVTTEKPFTIYHADWSPDGRYVAFSGGPPGPRLGWHPALIGIEAPGWNILVADAADTDRWVTITTDGLSNKEPDWVPAAAQKP